VAVLVAVTDHAVDRFRQRIGGRSGEVDVRPEIASRVARAWDAGRVTEEAPAGRGSRSSPRGAVYVHDLVDRALVFVCRHDRAAREVIVVTLWEQERGRAEPRVPRRWTDELRSPRSGGEPSGR
jgi:hypothetical protein